MKKWLCFLFLSLSTIVYAEGLPNYEIVIDKCGLAIETPALTHREMKKIRLENDLEAILISDPLTHQSGAALAVGVGSWNDPTMRPGMAHFVEHLLFLGTEKYPEEEGYSRYLDEHGGIRNAFTMADRTVYIFSVNNDGFLGALDRFGQFFISPLFNPSGVDRECKAIHQEYCRNLPLDPWRVYYVKKEMANALHPFHSFCIGNLDTLAKISQDELKEWYKENYSAHLMHLVVYSSLDMPTLEKEVAALFSHVKHNKHTTHVALTEPLMTTGKEPKLCAIVPVQDVQQMDLSWEIPRFYGQDREIHADKLLSHVLGHEGSTSLLAQLKREKLAESLAISSSRAGKDQCFLTLTIGLTAQGVQDYETVISRCFEALATLRQSGIPRYIYDEVCQIEELHYRFQSREEIFEFVSDYAMKMIDEPLETFPRQTLIPSCYAPEKIIDLITHLKPRNCQYTLVSSPKLSKMQPTLKEKWLGVEYTLITIPEEKMKKWEAASQHMAIAIPRPNPFLPSDLLVKGQAHEKTSILPHPELIADEPIGKVFASQDTEFLIPEISWTFTFKTPHILDNSPASHALADLYCHAVREALVTSTYEATIGGLAFSLSPVHGALELTVAGYSDKASELVEKVILTMKQILPSKEQFCLYQELMDREYLNSLYVSPLKQGSELLSSILFKDFSGLQQKSDALDKITYEQFSSFCNHVLNECYVEAMLYGNLSFDEAKTIWEKIKHTFAFTPFHPSRHPKLELASLPVHDHPNYLVLTSEHPANAVILTMDCGNFSFKKRAAQEILTKGLEEPFFSELRTKQQTAYLVKNASQELERHLYSLFAIQSSSHDTRDLLARFELFIETSLQNLSDKVISQERFESIKNAYIHQLKHPAENLNKMGALLHTIAFQYDADFDWMEKRVKAFEELTFEEFKECAEEFLGKSNLRRLAICVNGSNNKGKIAYRRAMTADKLRSEISYQGRQIAQN